MLVYKFGGASVKNATAICNLGNIVANCTENLVIVVSAMDKTTNALERLVTSWFQGKVVIEEFDEIKNFHYQIINELFDNKNQPVCETINNLFLKLKNYLAEEPSMNFDFEYDQVVCFGELVSTTIVNAYLESTGLNSKWVDIRKYLKTDEIYRDAKVDWELSASQMTNKFLFSDKQIYVTQGFIGSTINNLTTTLGREGSDYTASSLAYLLNAEKVVIWKDVPGIFNADPKFYPNAEKINEISYKEAVELAYYGAKIIHPKTIKPLQNKQIPLVVKSFFAPEDAGTVIHQNVAQLQSEKGLNPPIFIFKQNQILISIHPLDFSFIAEQNLSFIFGLMAKYRIKANLMENSAISFSVCVDNDTTKISNFIGQLKKEYNVLYNEGLELVTIRNYSAEVITEVINGRKIILHQKSRHTARYIVQ
jgi:aspartate kinase